jgi:predicted enzyme related to lactoylglutathione lyase
MRLQGTTICVANVSRSKAFYENVLGFQPGEFYEPTRWQPYWFEGQFFGVREVDSFSRQESFDITNFKVADVEKLWNGVKDQAQVVDELATTPWGSYKFVVKDPDGYLLGFVSEDKSPD